MKPPIIIPYRNRPEHLEQFVRYVAMVEPSRTIIVVEQTDGKPFNRGKLLNIGAQIAFTGGANHVITHDVDMLPVRADYSVGGIVHLAGAASQFNYKMPYPRYFGGVNIFSATAFYMANGYSNNYWGWGAEDDDMLLRCEATGIPIEFRPGRFDSLPHVHALHDPAAKITHKANCEYMNSGYDYSKDGLNTLQYEIVSDTKFALSDFEHANVRFISVDI